MRTWTGCVGRDISWPAPHQPTMSTQPETPGELAGLVEAYQRHIRHGGDDEFWAWERVHDIVADPDANRAYDLVLKLVCSAPDNQLGRVGAGPVEKLVRYHSSALIDQIESEARTDPRFCEALASIWLVADDIVPSVLARLQAVTNGRILVATQAEIDATAREYEERDAAPDYDSSRAPDSRSGH
jgi:hypothetical protein